MIAWESAGSAGFKGSRKSTPFAAQVTADNAARKGMEHGLEQVEVHAKGAGSGRETAIRALQAAGLQVTTVKDVTPQAHNGCRPEEAEARLEMARDTGPQCKQCRREGQKLFLKGERCLTDKCGVERRSYPPGEHGRGRLRASEYRQQLREKQKARRYYQVLEKQFRSYYDKASRQDGVTGENLLRLLERRFDNVLVRLGFAASRRQARQMIRHGHWQINGRRVDIPSYQVKPEDIDLDQVGIRRRDDRARGHRTDLNRAPMAAGRSRFAHRQGAAASRAGRDRLADFRAAHRRAVLEVAGPRKTCDG